MTFEGGRLGAGYFRVLARKHLAGPIRNLFFQGKNFCAWGCWCGAV